ncbi:MAG: hypothetical protein Q3997_05075 [Propionibacteriaceae bacterium]|nr:hypothetical protein [Propionibacteriaceae bacterium]
MRRLFWFALGVGLTVVVVTRGKEIMHRFTPAGVSEQVGEQAKNLLSTAREFLADMTAAMNEREAELRAELNMAPKN